MLRNAETKLADLRVVIEGYRHTPAKMSGSTLLGLDQGRIEPRKFDLINKLVSREARLLQSPCIDAAHGAPSSVGRFFCDTQDIPRLLKADLVLGVAVHF